MDLEAVAIEALAYPTCRWADFADRPEDT